MRRDYGSRLFALVDAPLNQTTKVDLYAATAEALRKWEPRIKVTSVSTQGLVAGKIDLEVTGTYGGGAVSLVVTV
jgi:phage baseplate assembly protein W